MNNIVLSLPDVEQEFIINCDASYSGLGSVLQQKRKFGLRPVAYASRTLQPNKQKFCITELECLSVVWAVQKFLPYFEESHFTVETDHKALQSILDLKETCGRVKRWAMQLASIDCTITYRRGTQNLVADALSRAPIENSTEPKKILVDRLLPVHDDETITFHLTQSDSALTVSVMNVIAVVTE
jgi:hypothetical protein